MGFPVSAAMIARSAAVGEPRWSPDGTRLGWLVVANGRADLVLAPTDGSEPAAVATADVPVTPIGAYGGGAWCWAGPDRLVVAGADGSLSILAAQGGPRRVLSASGRAAAPAATMDGTSVAFVLETDTSCRIAVVPTDGSAPPVAVSDADYAWDPDWSPDGRLLAWHEWDLERMSWDGSRIVVAGADGSAARTVAGGDSVAVGQPRFAPAGPPRLAFVSDESGWWNVHVIDPAGGGARAVLAEPHDHAEPSWGPGQCSFGWSRDGTRLALNRNELGFARLVTVDADGAEAATEHSKGWHHGLDWGAAGIVAVRSGARTPSAVTVVDPAGGRLALARGPVGGFEAAGLREPEPVSWSGDDGTTIHGRLTRPATSALGADRLPPLLVDVHGGPTGQSTVGWRPLHHYFATRGWAVLTADYRGSTGYGRSFRRALDHQWGVLDVADVAAGVRAAGDRGWSAPDRVAVCGGSAGALTALLVAARHAGLVRAAVSMYGVTDLFGLAATTHRFESRYLDRLVGVLPDDADRFRERSPVTHAAAIRCPLLLLQGDADAVVPPDQAKAMVDAVRAAGGTVEEHVYEGEGHGWRQPETVIDVYERTDEFLTRWVLGA